ncbi:uncharacterized protein PITG_09093 [Phytophthora infestans T30-4]|uniref:Uncharacterized protein n=1 Tax=Phytophthora infestans (strain T30-4) TaxID=403677 RepID=D0NBP3_PHYIT|nr:uncharacterized protein PITG_09093 [Phytophthora infestans T30-4]EEY55198.1 conserved hypothetical protein [Phytophthora infestans T30-4]|eukprot:XP_002903422.1 conserved hypothetical protein [Phytophthora infestans T30-4]
MSGKHEFCPGEKRMIVNSYEYIKSQKEQGLFKGIRTHQLVSDCLGCAPNTVDSVVNEKKNNPDTDFEQVGGVQPTPTMLVYNRAANRDVLLSLAKLNKPKAVYAANTIATRYNHRLSTADAVQKKIEDQFVALQKELEQ